MLQTDSFRYHWLFLGSALLIYLCTDVFFNALHQPYFWDELNVYFRAASHQYRFGLSLLPGSVPDEFSRGHPVLVPFYFALNFRLFGFTPLTAHTAAACLSTLGFFFLFLTLKKYTEPLKAWLITVVIMLQPAFLAQSIMLLPEMPLFTFCCGSLYFFTSRKLALSGLFALLALQIKESAVILPVALVLSDWISERKFIVKHFILLFVLPAAGFAAFLIAQYYQSGYFFYPLHTDLTKLEVYFIRERWQGVRSFLFFQQGHWLFLPLMLLPFLQFKKQMNERVIFPILFIGGICFSSLNYYLARYLCFFFAPFLAWLLLNLSIQLNHKKSILILVLLILAGNGVFHWKGTKYDDVDFSYIAHIENLKSTMAKLKEPTFKGRRIKIDFPFYPCYMDDGNGYDNQRNYELIMSKEEGRDFEVFTEPGNMHDTATLNPSDSLVAEIKNGIAFSRIYKIRSLSQNNK